MLQAGAELQTLYYACKRFRVNPIGELRQEGPAFENIPSSEKQNMFKEFIYIIIYYF